MSLRRIANQLSSAQKEFRARVEQIADAARLEMLPYFRKRGWRFRAGNGTYLVFDAQDEDQTERLPVRLRSIPALEIDAYSSLSDFIDDIDPDPSPARSS